MIRQMVKAGKSDVFLDLVKAFPLKPIHTETDHEAAGQMLRQLVGSKPEEEFVSGERDYLESLGILMHDYQRKQRMRTLASCSPSEILQHLMNENGMNVTDIGDVIGSRSAASMIVHGRRSPSKAHILRLAERFAVDPSLFL